MNYQTYLKTCDHHEKWVLEMMSGEVMSQKYRSVAIRAMDEYSDTESAKAAISFVFDWCEAERGYFPNDTKAYFLNITLDIFDTLKEQKNQ